MKKLTKVNFKKMYNDREFKLIHSFFKTSKEEAKKIILDVIHKKGIDKVKHHLIELSKCDIDNQGNIYKVECFIDDNFCFVECTIDNSINNECSWNDKEINTIAYLLN